MGTIQGHNRIHAEQFAGIPHLVDSIHVGVEGIVFRHVADSLPYFDTLGSYVVSQNGALPGGRLYEAKNGFEKRGLSCAVLPQEARGPSRHRDVQVAQGDVWTVGLGQFLGADDRFILHRHLRMDGWQDEP